MLQGHVSVWGKPRAGSEDVFDASALTEEGVDYWRTIGYLGIFLTIIGNTKIKKLTNGALHK